MISKKKTTSESKKERPKQKTRGNESKKRETKTIKKRNERERIIVNSDDLKLYTYMSSKKKIYNIQREII